MNTKDIIKHVKEDYKMLASYISGGIDADVDVIPIFIEGNKPLKIPNWLGKNATDYNAKEDKERILNEFINNPGRYGYGIILGKQRSGYHFLCLDIDIDNDCKEIARNKAEELLQANNMDYRVETTKSGRYHIYFIVDEITDNIKKLPEIIMEMISNYVNYEPIKYVYGKPVPGKIELLGLTRQVVTVYNGVINKLKPVFVDLPDVATAKDIKFDIAYNTNNQNIVNDETINKLIEVYKLIWKTKVFNGWDIDRAVSAFCVKNGIPEEQSYNIFKEIFADKYDEKWTKYLLEHTKQKQPYQLTNTATIVYHAKGLINSGKLSDEEKTFVRDFISAIGDEELPDYLIGVENVIQISSRKKFKAKKGIYYKEKYFVERYLDGVHQVLYVELEADEPNAIFGKHELINDPEPRGVKVEIVKFIKEKKRIAEVLINDEISFVPTTSFNRINDVVEEIASECFNFWPDIDISLFRKYIAYKINEFYKKHGGKPKTCLVSKNTGWNDDCSMFFHYALNDEKHELSKDNIIYKNNKAVLLNTHEQHRIVFDALKEGKLLGVLFAISASSILIKPLQLQPITCILAGNSGAGKTTAAKLATSLFYKSDDLLITANNTKVSVELSLAGLNSMPFLVDEGALANSNIDLQHLIFSVSSGKGKARGKKDLSVDIKDIQSNVFYTTETTDIDYIRRAGTFRRMLYFVVQDWLYDVTTLFSKRQASLEIVKKHAGCGVDYIKYAIENLDKLKEQFDNEIYSFGNKYSELDAMAGTIYAGIILLEQYYGQFTKRKLVFKALRNYVDRILEEAKKLFVASKDDVVLALQQYLYSIHDEHFAHVIQNENGRYDVIHRATKELYGEYDVKTKTYCIIQDKFKIIAKELEKERSLLINALSKAGVLLKPEKDKKDKKDKGYTFVYRSKVTQGNVRVYKINFEGYQPKDEDKEDNSPVNPEPPPEPLPEPPQEPPEQPPSTDEIDDSIVEAFSRTSLEEQAKKKQAKEQEKPKQEKEKAPQPQEKKKEEKAQAEAQAVAEDNRIIINEDELNIYDVKPREEIPKFEIKQKDLIPFNELVVASIDIETTGLNETDQILAIAFDVYKGDNLESKHRFYLDEYNNDEAKMIDAVLDSISKLDIDVLTGYNIYSFDLPMIKAKDQNNRLRFTDPVNISSVFIKNELQKGYNIIVDGKQIEVIDAYYLVIKYDNVTRDIPAQDYKLKSVAKYFNISKEDRVILSADEIRQYYYTNRKLFDEYHSEDVREAYEIFKKLAPPYYYMLSILPFNISFFDAFRLSTAAIWERILERYYDPAYKGTITADDKKDYEGGLVIVNRGIYKDVYKIDVASLYPNIMLNYQIHSRKDTKKVALSILNEYTNQRLELKKKAKAGDVEADLIQSALKILINSLYGFYGTAGYLFNDMKAAATVTAFGRKILRYMIDYVEKHGGIVIECDTDGIFYSAPNGEEIYQGLLKELNKINFDIELEHRGCVMYASDKKNYIILTQDGKVVKKGSKFVGRDKNKLQTEFVVEYIKRYIEDPAKAESYKEEIRNLIASGKAYDYVKITKKVGKNEKNIIIDAALKGMKLEQGSIVTYAYKNYRKRHYTFDIDEIKTYDEDYYIDEFDKLVKEIDEVIKCVSNG